MNETFNERYIDIPFYLHISISILFVQLYTYK